MTHLKHTLAAAAAFGVLALAPTGASAIPNGLPSISQAAPSNIEELRWVCGPRRCWWRPGWYRGYGWRHRGGGGIAGVPSGRAENPPTSLRSRWSRSVLVRLKRFTHRYARA